LLDLSQQCSYADKILLAEVAMNQAIGTGQGHEQTWDAMETYFECITECSLDDGACVSRCVEALRQGDSQDSGFMHM
jgi:hypothetical protein